jgi:hypothetical protein
MRISFQSIFLLSLSLVLSGCDGSPESKAKLRALSQASCSLSMHCNNAPTSRPHPRKTLTLMNPLQHSYRRKGNTMCAYSDGSIVNIGVGICPLNL